MHLEITQDANQLKQFDYDEHYWNNAFDECFKDTTKMKDGFAGNHSLSRKQQGLNNSLLNLNF